MTGHYELFVGGKLVDSHTWPSVKQANYCARSNVRRYRDAGATDVVAYVNDKKVQVR